MAQGFRIVRAFGVVVMVFAGAASCGDATGLSSED